MKRAETYYQMAARMRRHIAADLFAPPAIAAVIHEAASLGYRRYRIVQAYPFDLSCTEAAQALERWLIEEQFRYIWRTTYIEGDPHRPTPGTEYPELEILW
jgi:hypothetical protein